MKEKAQMDKTRKNVVLGIFGGIMLLAGITLVLVWWEHTVVVFKGVIGAVLAVGAVVVLSFIRE